MFEEQFPIVLVSKVVVSDIHEGGQVTKKKIKSQLRKDRYGGIRLRAGGKQKMISD
jgi:hypothetical protein